MSVSERTTAEELPARQRRVADARLVRAHELVERAELKVLSLDVFDTALWRRVPDPVDAFPLIGERLLERELVTSHVTPLMFKQLRIVAEQRARLRSSRAGRGVEIALEDVYRRLRRDLVFETDPAELARVEVEVERELLVPDLDILELVRAARAAGKLVIAVSDTYFPEADLRSMLDPHYGFGAEIDRVFASNAYGEGKTSGLFEIVLRELGRDPAEVLHVGDNRHADIESPRRLGIRTLEFERRPPQLERIVARERAYVEEHRVRRDGDYGLTALRGKVMHRREAAELPPELRPFWTYGAVCLGPALCGFAEWLHERAHAHWREQERMAVPRTTTVHCLMREGELISRLVNDAGVYLNSSLTAEPLWLSRQVCARASIFEGTTVELRALLSRRRQPTVRELCETLGVDIGLSGVLGARADARMNDPALVDEVLGELTSNPDLTGPMVQQAALLRERVVRYVRARVAAEPGALLLVDLGWGGTIQKLLDDILEREGVPIQTTGLYLVTHELAAERMVDGSAMLGYLGSLGLPAPAVRAIMRSPEILEQVCMPDVGSQVDLTADLEPVLSAAADSALEQSAERGAVQAGIRAFQREWARYAEFVPRWAPLAGEDARELLRAQVVRAAVGPTRDEAAVFGGWVHDENYGSLATERIVGERGLKRTLRHMDAAALIALPMSELYWPFGLAALADEHLAAAAEAVGSGQLPAEAFSSLVETGNFDVYYDNGFGYGEQWKLPIAARRNRFGLSHVRAELRADEIRGIRLDPAKAPCAIRLDWVALHAWSRGRADPQTLVLDTPEALERLTIRGAEPLAPKLWLATGDDPQFELDLRAVFDGTVYEVVVECGYALLPAAAPRADSRALAARTRQQARARAVKRFVRQIENRTGLPVGEPLRKGWRALRRRVG